MNIEIRKLFSLEEMLPHYELITQLTPKITFEKYEAFLKEMVPHNYFQVVAIVNGITVGVSGFWIATKIYIGKYLEVDNFVVDANFRSMKIGQQLLQWMEQEAIQNECKAMMLDAYLENTEAHKFYENAAFKATGFHFVKKMNKRL